MLPVEIKNDILKQYDSMADDLKHISLFVPKSLHLYDSTLLNGIKDSHNRSANTISMIVTKNSPYEKYTNLAKKYIARPGRKIDTYIPNPSINGVENGGYYTSIADSIAIRNKYELITFPGEESVISGKEKSASELLKYKLKKLKVPVTKIEKIVLSDDIYYMNELVYYVDYENYEKDVLNPFRTLYAKYLEFYKKKYKDDINFAILLAEESAKDDVWVRLGKLGYVKHEYTDGKVDDWKRYHKCFRKGYAHDFKESRYEYSRWCLKEQVRYDNRPLDEHGKIIKLVGRVK